VLVDGLGQELSGPGFHGSYRRRDGAVRGEKDEGKSHLCLSQLVLKLQPTEIGEPDLKHETTRNIRPFGAEESEG
jgi:hypothetical protein